MDRTTAIKVTPLTGANRKLLGWQVYYWSPRKDAPIRRVNGPISPPCMTADDSPT